MRVAERAGSRSPFSERLFNWWSVGASFRLEHDWRYLLLLSGHASAEQVEIILFGE